MPEASGFRMQESGCENQDAGCSSDAAELNPESRIPNPVTGTLLAFDFGTQRIGVAVGNTFSASASPLTTISEEKNEIRFAAIAALIGEWQPAALLVGLPCNEDGTPHELTALCHRFAKRLHGRFALLTMLVDERYTSIAASEQLNKQGIRGKSQKHLIDQYAAQQIMQAYFDEPAACVIVNADRKIHEKSPTQ